MALIVALDGLVTFLDFAFHFLNRLLDFLQGASLTRAAHVGNFLPKLPVYLRQLVSQAAKLKR